MITRTLDSCIPILRFIENAGKYGHTLDIVIATHSLGVSPQVTAGISKRVSFCTIDLYEPQSRIDQLKRLGVSEYSATALIGCPDTGGSGLVPYGTNRNAVIIEALLRGVDILIFADTDVYPSVISIKDGQPVFEEIDFFGCHLKHLNAGSQITTSEYSGYNILPPAEFEGMYDLLLGLRKDDMRAFWESSMDHQCFIAQPQLKVPVPCAKVLGGNMGFWLSAFSVLPPFFAPYYTDGEDFYLARGEDTGLSPSIAKTNTVCTDIKTYVCHDTYDGFDRIPDLKNNAATQKRFYHACTGWIGRNPFLSALLGEDIREIRDFQRAHLTIGSRSLANYTSNPIFGTLTEKFDISWDNIERYSNEYERVLEAWSEFCQIVY
jgi:hypothetical protein